MKSGKNYKNGMFIPISKFIVPITQSAEREDIIIISCLIITKVTGEKLRQASSMTREVARILFDHLL